jgi:glyoxylase I family protein
MGFPSNSTLENWVSSGWAPPALTLRPRGQGLTLTTAPRYLVRGHPACVPRAPPALADRAGPAGGLAGEDFGRIARERNVPEWRHRTLFFRDPEDNVIEIYAEY